MKYKAIVSWCKLMGSADYWIDEQIKKATTDKAPETAVFKKDGKWVRFEDLPEFNQFRMREYYGYDG